MDQSLGFNLLTAFHFPLLLHHIFADRDIQYQKLGRGEVPYFLWGGHFVCEMSLSLTEHLVA